MQCISLLIYVLSVTLTDFAPNPDQSVHKPYQHPFMSKSIMVDFDKPLMHDMDYPLSHWTPAINMTEHSIVPKEKNKRQLAALAPLIVPIVPTITKLEV